MARRSTLALALVGAAVALAAAGCGGGSRQSPAPTSTVPAVQAVAGPGFSFSAPAGWNAAATPRGVAVAGPGESLLSVSVYTLVKKYDPAKAAAAAKELDKVAAQLAAGRTGGRVSSSETVTVAGIPSRSYRIVYVHEGNDLVQQVTFVLRASTEWQLVCRRLASGPDGDCARLLSTFALKTR